MAERQIIKISDQLRQIIDDCGMSRYRLAQEMEIDESALSKFYNGQRGLSMKALDRLGECLGLVVAVRPRKGR